MLVPPSPKVHTRLVTVPLEASVKFTTNVAAPLVGVPPKPATGATALEPVTAFVDVPPLLAKTTEPVNAPAATGLKLTLTCPVSPPPTLNGLPLTTAKGTPEAVAVPVKVWTPALTTEKVCVLLWPTGSRLKLRLPGDATRSGGIFV